jgi:hypothetical protein
MDDRAFIREFEGFHNKRFLAFVGLALLAFIVAVGGLVRGFRGNHVRTSADAMTYSHTPPARTPPAPPPANP